MKTVPRLMIAAPASGSGKSVIASGLMAAFSAHSIVQGFKVGPDYIDPMYHTAATGRPSRNLDPWMLSTDKVQKLFTRASEGASLSIVEGVMGLFDGYGSDLFQGSSAQVACLLNTPVILVIDCSKMSGSAAALVHGFNTFYDRIHLAGVICNRVGSTLHGKWLTEAIEKRNSIPVLGCVPRLPALQVPERHLGLFTVAERPDAVREFIHQAALLLADHIDLERLLKIAHTAELLPNPAETEPPLPQPTIRLAVAQDEAFCFYYEDNLDELRRCGAELISFSPLEDKHLPDGISGLYFGGGYPELYAERLSQNSGMLSQVLTFCRQNMPVYAECGGLMYLTQGFRSNESNYPLIGALPGWCEMSGKLTMGYREVVTSQPNLLVSSGECLRGHEFHYSHWQVEDALRSAYQVLPRSVEGTFQPEGYVDHNLLASYIHLHFGQNPQLAHNLIDRCRAWQAIQPD
jgi:cobyrinic acid a,c-diamide synthase